jgi:hypothetical protein
VKAAAIIVSLLVCQGCHTHSQCRRGLFESKFASAVDALSTLQYVDKGNPEQLRTHAVMGLAARLEELQTVMKTADKDDLERLTRVILKHAEAHKTELSKSKGSLEMLDALKRLTTEPANIKRVSELEGYVAAERKHLPLLER